MNVLTKAMETTGRTLMHFKPIAKIVRKCSKNKPEILAVTGGVTIVAAFGWAIYNAVGLKDTLDETAEEVKSVEAEYEEKLKDISEEERASAEKEYKTKLRRARVHGVFKVAKKFSGPAVALGIGMTLGTKAVIEYRIRNAATLAALKGSQEAYRFLLNNVKKEQGEEAAQRYSRGVVGEQEIEETIKKDNGKEEKVKKKIPVVKNIDNPWRFEYSDYWFGSWQDSSERNLFFLKCAQEWWTHELNRNGEAGVSMYDVLKYLNYNFDLQRETLGKEKFRQFMHFIRNNGWRKGSKGDGFVDLGIYRAINEPAVKMLSDVIYIEMNCDGPFDD